MSVLPGEAGGIDRWLFDYSLKREAEGQFIEWPVSFDCITFPWKPVN